jgi:tetratricopeptide (TPR) repeat protein
MPVEFIDSFHRARTMSKRVLSCLVVITALQFALVSTSRAQGTMSFGTEDVAQPAAPQDAGPYDEFLAEGKKLYDAGKYDEASLMFYKIVSATEPAAEVVRPEAQYELGKALLRLELYQGALSYFGRIVDIGDTHPFYLPALRGLVLLTDAIPGDPALMDRLAVYSSYFPQNVPEKYRDQFAYLVGRHLYQQMRTDEALRLLTAVSERSPYYAPSRYIAAITHVANYRAEPAVEQFKEVLRYLEGRDAAGELSPKERELLELTTLGMARTFYSTGDYGTSLKYYSQIDRDSERWPQALFESSWAFFQTDDYNKALGNLHSLNSPFFSDAYFPEGPILSAVIYFYNCKYPRVRSVLSDFDYYYAPLKDDVQAVIAQYQDPTQMYDWIRKLQNGEVDFDPRVYQILDAALNDAEVSRTFELVEVIEKETEKIETMPDAWKSSPLGVSLVQESQLALSFARNNAGTLASQRLERVVRELDELIRQKEEIKFEVARAEQGQIQADIRAGMNVVENVTRAPEIEVTDEQLYWTFDGEYWRDELGAYVFNMNSECSR